MFVVSTSKWYALKFMFSYLINHHMFDWSEKVKDGKRGRGGEYNLPKIDRKEGEIGCELKMSNKPFIQVIVSYYYFLSTTNYHFLYSTSINNNSLGTYHLILSPFLSTKQSRAIFIFYHSTFLSLQPNTHQEKYKYFLSNNMITTSCSNTHKYK